VAYRSSNRAKEPAWHNAPVPSFGALSAPLLVVGLAPGVRGANRTGRPFTGDYAGVLLYATLLKFGFAKGHYAQSPDDGLELIGTRIKTKPAIRFSRTRSPPCRICAPSLHWVRSRIK
jgi:uracil-DNA glycosylase